MCRYKLLTFDIHNTVLKVRGSPGIQYNFIAKKYGIEANSTALDSAYKYVYKQKSFEQPVYGTNHGVTPKQWWRDIVKHCFLRAGYQGEKRRLEAVSDELYKYFVSPSSWEVLPHAHETLRYFKQKGVILAVISNFDERMEIVLRNMKLRDYFDFTVSSFMTKICKPDPRMFHAALDLANVKCTEAAHIGDNLKKDYIGARNVGMDAYLICNSVTPDILKEVREEDIIHDLADLKSVLVGTRYNISSVGNL